MLVRPYAVDRLSESLAGLGAAEPPDAHPYAHLWDYSQNLDEYPQVTPRYTYAGAPVEPPLPDRSARREAAPSSEQSYGEPLYAELLHAGPLCPEPPQAEHPAWLAPAVPVEAIVEPARVTDMARVVEQAQVEEPARLTEPAQVGEPARVVEPARVTETAPTPSGAPTGRPVEGPEHFDALFTDRSRSPRRPAVGRSRRTPSVLQSTVLAGILLATGVSVMRARTGSGGEATGALGAEIAVREAAGTSTVESCQITHSIASQSPGRFMAVVTITNSGDSMVRGWTLRWAYPEVEPAAMPRLGDGWNAAVSVDAVGGQAIDVEASRLIPAGGSTTIAFVGTGGDGVPDPTDFTLNGVRCG